jgi:hypothetical protein
MKNHVWREIWPAMPSGARQYWRLVTNQVMSLYDGGGGGMKDAAGAAGRAAGREAARESASHGQSEAAQRAASERASARGEPADVGRAARGDDEAVHEAAPLPGGRVPDAGHAAAEPFELNNRVPSQSVSFWAWHPTALRERDKKSCCEKESEVCGGWRGGFEPPSFG